MVAYACMAEVLLTLQSHPIWSREPCLGLRNRLLCQQDFKTQEMKCAFQRVFPAAGSLSGAEWIGDGEIKQVHACAIGPLPCSVSNPAEASYPVCSPRLSLGRLQQLPVLAHLAYLSGGLIGISYSLYILLAPQVVSVVVRSTSTYCMLKHLEVT